MLTVAASVRPSPRHGDGLFLDEPARRGQVVAILTPGTTAVPEEEYERRVRSGDAIARLSGIRVVERWYVVAESPGPEERINHDDDPSLLFHCGLCFARGDLPAGTELTVDYRYWLGEDDPDCFVDRSTGAHVHGWPAEEALRRSTRELARLLAVGPPPEGSGAGT